jgi:type II restriction enzyme
MKLLPTHKSMGLENPDEIFHYLIESLRPSLKLWTYFVNWDKVFRKTRALEVQLNIWNYLLGKENFEEAFHELLSQHPEIVKCIPTLIVRDGANSEQFQVIDDLSKLTAEDAFFDFSKPADTKERRDEALTFLVKSGLISLFKKDGVKNLVDYVLGVEAGLDSNGRKNRSGKSMEAVVEAFLADFTKKRGLEYISQARAPQIFKKWGFEVPVDKSTRRYDFAVSDGSKLAIIEVNFYGGSGSKLNATAGSYVGLHRLLTSKGFEFIWITDGEGWRKTHHPLREAFDKIDHLWNLKFLDSGCLDDIFGK